jgi:pantoate--beta-alanine ligase
MVKDLNMDVEIVGVPTVREPDGLAMSSRNSYLSPEERESAKALYGAILLAQRMVAEGERDVSRIIGELQGFILRHKHTRIDYVKIVDPDQLKELKEIKGDSLLAMAVFVGSTRLIDNSILKIS